MQSAVQFLDKSIRTPGSLSATKNLQDSSSNGLDSKDAIGQRCAV
jgi:hypothetical protein